MAGRIPEEFINEVRSNVNIVDIISQYVSLEKKGKRLVLVFALFIKKKHLLLRLMKKNSSSNVLAVVKAATFLNS